MTAKKQTAAQERREIASVDRETFDDFRTEQKMQHEAIAETQATINTKLGKLDKLEPLAPLIPILVEIAEDKKAMQRSAKKFGKFMAYVGVILGVLYTLYRFAMDLFYPR